MTLKPKVSIIIINFNSGPTMLTECLESLLISMKGVSAEVILVDNASWDESFEEAKKRFESVKSLRFIKNQENIGFAAANGLAVKEALGEYIVFLNSDTVVDKAWLENLLSSFSHDGRIAAAQAKLLSYHDPQKIDSAGGYIDILGNAMEQGRFYFRLSKDEGQFDGIREIFSGCAAALAVKKNIFNEAGGFDSDFFIFLEDVDLSWRMRLMGYKIVLASQSVVFHRRGGTRESLSQSNRNTVTFHLYKNQMAMLLKNYGWPMLLIVLLFVFVLYFLRIFRPGNGGVLTVYRSLKWNIKSLPKTLKKRRHIQRGLRRVRDRDILKFIQKVPLRVQYLIKRIFFRNRRK